MIIRIIISDLIKKFLIIFGSILFNVIIVKKKLSKRKENFRENFHSKDIIAEVLRLNVGN